MKNKNSQLPREEWDFLSFFNDYTAEGLRSNHRPRHKQYVKFFCGPFVRVWEYFREYHVREVAFRRVVSEIKDYHSSENPTEGLTLVASKLYERYPFVGEEGIFPQKPFLKLPKRTQERLATHERVRGLFTPDPERKISLQLHFDLSQNLAELLRQVEYLLQSKKKDHELVTTPERLAPSDEFDLIDHFFQDIPSLARTPKNTSAYHQKLDADLTALGRYRLLKHFDNDKDTAFRHWNQKSKGVPSEKTQWRPSRFNTRCEAALERVCGELKEILGLAHGGSPPANP
jgi:hypothetical protein